MSDEEYYRLLKALGGKHFCHSEYSHEPDKLHEVDKQLHKATEEVRRFNEGRRRRDREELLRFLEQLDPQLLEKTHKAMEDAGMLDALDEGFPAVLTDFRASSLPIEERGHLLGAGFTGDEIDVLFLLVREYGLRMDRKNVRPSEVFEKADETIRHSIEIIVKSGSSEITPKRKRKILNGVGKVLAGSIGGLSNVLLFTGTILAPNPATAAGGLASGAVAISAIFGGLGDLRGE